MDEAVGSIAKLEGLTFLDLSFNKGITDAGLEQFRGKHYPVTELFLNGLTGVTAVGLTDIIASCSEMMVRLEAGLMD